MITFGTVIKNTFCTLGGSLTLRVAFQVQVGLASTTSGTSTGSSDFSAANASVLEIY